MSGIDVQLIGVDRLMAKLHAMGPEAEARVRKAARLGMLAIRDEVMKSIRPVGKHGKFYHSKRNPKVMYQASAPDEPPSQDTTELKNGITNVLDLPGDEVGVMIISQAPYSADLEYGTSNMEARPFMGPAFRHNKAYCKELIKISLKNLGLI